MTTYSYSPPSRKTEIATQISIALAGGFVLFIIALLVWTLGYQLVYSGRIFPGVSVAGVDLSGLEPSEASVKLTQHLTFPYQGEIYMRDGEQIWLASPAELGMVFDASASAKSAYKMGRSGGLFSAFADQLEARRQGTTADAVIIFDQHIAYAYLQRIALEVDQPPVEASLAIQGAEVVAQPGQIGRYLNVDAALIALSAQLKTFHNGEVGLIVDEMPPKLLDVSSQADTARQILSAPLVLNLAGATELDPGPWAFDVQTVAKMLVVQKKESENGDKLEIVLDKSILGEILIGIAEQVDRDAENARFIFNDETTQLEILRSSVVGRKVNLDASGDLINESILKGEHEVDLQTIITAPKVKETMTAAELGVIELVHSETSYFYGSSTERIQNIQTAAAAFQGVMVAPGETFAMGSVLGDISLDNGYAEALIIYGGRTIKGVGGGVCQVSTTLFRNAFFGGFPIEERHSHAYRVYYYEQSPDGSKSSDLVGLDATVYIPLVDLKFTNDTPHWLLMETYTDVAGRNLTWKFYSTSDGRTVDWTTTGAQNIVDPPEPLFIENEELAKNEIEQVDWSAKGADVSIQRTVFRNGQVIIEDVFNTHYEPWQSVCEYGPETNNPEKKAKDQGICQ